MSEQITQRKKCSICGRGKLVTEFSPHPRGLYGVQGYCRECQNERRKQKYNNDLVFRMSQQAASLARSRALERLAELHPERFTALLNEERAAEGLRPTERPKKAS
jgi:hypothetical protein